MGKLPHLKKCNIKPEGIKCLRTEEAFIE